MQHKGTSGTETFPTHFREVLRDATNDRAPAVQLKTRPSVLSTSVFVSSRLRVLSLWNRC